MRKHYLRKIALLAVGLIASATVALANTVNAEVKMTYVDYNNPDENYGIVETAKTGYNKISGGVVNFANTGWGCNWVTFLNVDASGIDGKINSAILNIESSGSTDSKRTASLAAGYNSTTWSESMTYNTADRSITTIGDMVWTTSKSASTFNNLSIDISKAFENDDDGIVTILLYNTSAAGSYLKNPVVTIDYTPAGETPTTYTVKFVDLTDQTIKEDAVYNTAVGNKFTASTEDMATFYTVGNTVKYLYVGGNETKTAVEDANSNVIKLVFNTASTFSYTVSASTGSVIAEGSNFEDEYITVPYPAYQLIGSTLYAANKQSGNPHWGYGFTLAQNNQSETITYTQSVDNVVYYKEAEDIEGATFNDGNNGNIRCSMQAGAYFSEDTEFVTLAPGAYKIAMGVWGNAGVTFTVNAGETAVHSAETQGYHYTTESEEFILTEETALKVLAAGSNGKVIDWIYIIKTGDAVKVGSAGWTSFVTTTSVAIPENVEAYIITETSGGYAELTKVTGVVPTNTALLVNASESSFVFENSSEAAADVSGNILLASDGTVIGDGITIYALGKKEAGIGFYLVENGQSIPAGKAYLKVSTGEAKNFYAFGFDDATVINGIESSTNKEGIIYNLKGQRVNSMTNGIYIVNGKKIFVK